MGNKENWLHSDEYIEFTLLSDSVGDMAKATDKEVAEANALVKRKSMKIAG